MTDKNDMAANMAENSLPLLSAGDWVRVRLAGSHDEWCPALVATVSDTQPQSVAFELHGFVRSRAGAIVGIVLLVTIDYERETVTSVMGDEYEVEVCA